MTRLNPPSKIPKHERIRSDAEITAEIDRVAERRSELWYGTAEPTEVGELQNCEARLNVLYDERRAARSGAAATREDRAEVVRGAKADAGLYNKNA